MCEVKARVRSPRKRTFWYVRRHRSEQRRDRARSVEDENSSRKIGRDRAELRGRVGHNRHMHSLPFLSDFVVLFGVAAVVIAVSARISLPPLVGYLLTGALVGPYSLELIHDSSNVEVLAELGIVFLLFAIGLEMPTSRLKALKRFLLAGGPLQFGVTTLVSGAVFLALGYSLNLSILFASCVSISSTVILLRLYHRRRELHTLHGRAATGILLFQDILIVPLLLLVPILAGADSSGADIGRRILWALAAVTGAFLVGRFALPRVLHLVAAVRIGELLTVAALFLCLAGALLTSELGFSPALGGFLAGILLAESDYRHQIAAGTGPFRDILASFFFITMGMLLDLRFFFDHWCLVLVVCTVVVISKALCAGAAAKMLGFTIRTAVLTGIGVAQIGEFALVLLRRGHTLELVDSWHYQLGITVSILTMLITPVAHRLGARLFQRASSDTAGGEPPQAKASQVIIFGYGINGQHLARLLGEASISHVIVDANPYSVRSENGQHEILFGDCSSPAIQEQAGIRLGKIAVFAISDAEATKQGVRLARQVNPNLYIIARARAVFDIEELRSLGADIVVTEEFEASVEIVIRVLQRLHVPGNIIRTQARLLRDDAYGWLRRASTLSHEVTEAVGAALSTGTGETFWIGPENPIVGSCLSEVGLRGRTGASVIALIRGSDTIANPAPDLQLEAHDVLVLIGSHSQVEAAFALLSGPAEEESAD